MKKAILFAIGASPLVLGYALSSAMLHWKLGGTLLCIIGILILVYWRWVGALAYDSTKNMISAVVIGNAIEFIVLFLILFLKIIMYQYRFVFVENAMQIFCMPTLAISVIDERLTFFFLENMWVACLVSFVLMIVSFCIGYYIKSRKTHSKN